MTTPVEANVHAIAMDGDFDDAQARVKERCVMTSL